MPTPDSHEVVHALRGGPATLDALHARLGAPERDALGWAVDDAGLPMYRYTLDQARAPFARQPELLGRTDAWHQVGNERAIAAGDALAHRHEGFWAPMDTLKEKQWLESLHESGQAPWELWANGHEAEPDVAQLASA